MYIYTYNIYVYIHVYVIHTYMYIYTYNTHIYTYMYINMYIYIIYKHTYIYTYSQWNNSHKRWFFFSICNSVGQLEGIMLGEISQRKTNTVLPVVCGISKMNEWISQNWYRLIDIENILLVTRGENEGRRGKMVIGD